MEVGRCQNSLRPPPRGANAVCVTCKKLKINGKWANKKATDAQFKILGRVICPGCSPKTDTK